MGCCGDAPGGIRTHDLRLRRPTLYPAELLARTSRLSRLSRSWRLVEDSVNPRQPPQPSQRSLKSGRVDLNHRPPGPEPGALTGLRYAPMDELPRRLDVWTSRRLVLMRPEG